MLNILFLALVAAAPLSQAAHPPTDEDLARAIRAKISTQPALRFATLGVTVTRGVAKLTGEVAQPSQKTQAFVDALEVDGIVGVDAYGLVVRPLPLKPPVAAAREDEDIYDEVAGSMGADARIGENITDISVKNGNVRLSGTFSSLSAKLAAESDAAAVIGVVRVLSDIVVKPPERFSDRQLNDAVNSVLHADPELNGRPIMAHVKDSVVMLHGRVKSAGEWLLATRDVAQIPGVVGLRNGIEVGAPGESPEDNQIKQSVDIQIDHDPILSPGGGNQLDTVVKNGVVIITGSVVSITEYTRALLDAFQGGAKAVWNQLKIQAGEPPGIAMRYFETYPGEIFPLGYGEPEPNAKSCSDPSAKLLEQGQLRAWSLCKSFVSDRALPPSDGRNWNGCWHTECPFIINSGVLT
ncbi:MAG: BON domain-containing protein [Deltaproteobacteria bacterium]|nr:BON domain-containing protein [Deltaproteobacteria bacterium]